MNLEALQRVLLRASEAREPRVVLHAAVEGLSQLADVALARAWLVSTSAERCAECPGPPECDAQGRCLELAASAGRSLGGASWSRLDGAFRRVPMGARKIGVVARDGVPVVVDVTAGSHWIAHPEWARAERLESMAAYPMAFGEQTLGVLAVFVRRRLSEQELRFLALFAHGTAIAVANARALDEVERLRRALEAENTSLRDALGALPSVSKILGSSPAIVAMLRQLELVARTDTAVLVLGESGTGKELVAREVHERSPRRAGPFIKVNCAAIPRELFESEFFGHGRGAFTGAVRDRLGRFELANGGTLFLDEIGEVPLELQSKLLRVLQESTFERVGEERTRRADVRIVAATNRDLAAEAKSGAFRPDLFYRLATFPVSVPPLRARREDIPLLARHFVEVIARRLGVRPPALEDATLQRLCAHDWPGNVRELAHGIERGLILGEGRRVVFDELSGELAPTASAHGATEPHEDAPILRDEELRALERDNLRRALDRAEGQIYGPRGAAALLGVPPSTMASRLRAHGLVAKKSTRA